MSINYITFFLLEINQVQKGQSQRSGTGSCLEQEVQVGPYSLFGWSFLIGLNIMDTFSVSFCLEQEQECTC